MALQPIDVPFVAGQDEASNTKVLPLPRLKRAVNARCLKQNQFRKIRGTEAIGTATPDAIGPVAGPAPVGPVRLFTHQDQLVACSEDSLFTLSEATDPSKFEEVENGVVATVTGKLTLGHYGSRDVASCSVARTDAFTVYAWFSTAYVDAAVTSYQLHVMTVDNVTGAGSAGTLVETASDDENNINPSVKCVALGSKVTVFWGETVSSFNRIRYLDITSPTSGPYPTGDQGTNLLTGGVWSTAQFFDVAEHNGGYVIAYVGNAAAEVVFARYNASHVLQATSAAIAITGDEARVGIVGNMSDNGATIHLAIISDDGEGGGILEVYGLDDDMDTQHVYSDTESDPPFAIAFGPFDEARSQLLYGEEDKLRLKYFANGTLITQSGYMPDSFVCGKPIGRDGKSFFAIQYRTSQPNSCAALVRVDPGFDGAPRAITTPKPEVMFNRGQAVSELTVGTNTTVDPAGSVTFDDDVLRVCVPIVDRYSGPITAEDPTGQNDPNAAAGTVAPWTTDVMVRIGADAWEFSFGERDRYQAVELGGYTFLGGGTVLQFDGKRAVELGFISYPDITEDDLAPSPTDGDMADGTYTYGFVWEWVDYLGNRHQSAAKLVQTTITGGGGNGSVTITLPPGLVLTFKDWRIQGGDGRPVVLAIYRSRSSEEDASGGTPSLHRLEGSGIEQFTENRTSTGFWYNSLGDWVDTYNSDDELLVTRELLYTSSLGASELDNVPPPPSRCIVAHDGRLFGIDDTNPRRIWYTKQIFPGSGAAWNETLVVMLEEDGVALASQDGNLIVFCRHSIFTVIGRPADNTGATTGYEPPQRLSTELGCTNPRSVLATPAGTFFESTRGIHVLPRGGNNPEFIGKAVEDTLASYPIITSVCHVEAESTVLFACVDQEDTPATATGRVLAYQYDIGQWFVREYAGKPVSSMVVHQGNLVLGIYEDAADCTVWREDDGWDDAEGNFVGWTIETGDIRLGGFAGMHRINHLTVLAERLGTCRLQIREQVDGGGWSQPVAWNATTTEEEFLRHYQTMRPKGTSHRFEFRELQFGDVVDSEGLAVTGVSLAATQLRGATRLAAHRMG